MKKILVTSFIILLMVACSENNKQKESEEVTMLKEKIAKFVPVEIQYDETLLTDREKIVLEKLYRASQIIDEIFLEQVYSKNDLIKSELTKSEDELSKLQLEYFNIMFGPFDRLEDNAPFIGTDKKPLGADFYPEDMTKDEF